MNQGLSPTAQLASLLRAAAALAAAALTQATTNAGGIAVGHGVMCCE